MINAYVVHQKPLNISFLSVTYTLTKEIQLSTKYPIKLIHLFFCQAVHCMMMQSMWRYLKLYKDSLLKVADSISELVVFSAFYKLSFFIFLYKVFLNILDNIYYNFYLTSKMIIIFILSSVHKHIYIIFFSLQY